MRVVYSDKVEKLWDKIEPYFIMDGLTLKLDSDAPDDIKKAYKEYKILSHKEYEEAMKLM